MKLLNRSVLTAILALALTQTAFTANRNTIGVAAAPLLLSPGDYTTLDRSQIETKKINWAMLNQSEDRALYQKAADESYAAYLALYGTCQGNSCTGLQSLRFLHNKSVNQRQPVSASELTSAITSFISLRDVFLQKLAAIEVNQKVWQGVAQNSAAGNQKLMYNAGAINLAAFATTYKEAIAKIDKEASQFTYRFKNGVSIVETKPGMGLEVPTSQDTPETLAASLSEYQNNLKLSSNEQDDLNMLSIELGRHMLKYFSANGDHLVWYNSLQDSDKKSWQESMQTKARILQYVRAVYCMKIGVPGLEIPKGRKFNLDYLTRGVPSQSFRIAQKAEFDEASIRETLTQFDRVFLSVQSQAGALNDSQGIMRFLNRVNSTFTWHNEVDAYLNMMHILRENMIDELDLLTDRINGCKKVRERYYTRFGSLKDTQFRAVIDSTLGGLNVASGDPLSEALADAGKVILTKGLYSIKVDKFMKEHPTASLSGQAIDELGDDIR